MMATRRIQQLPEDDDCGGTISESASVDDIPINEFSDDNIDDIVEANTMSYRDDDRLPGKRARPLCAEDIVDQFADGVDDLTTAGKRQQEVVEVMERTEKPMTAATPENEAKRANVEDTVEKHYDDEEDNGDDKGAKGAAKPGSGKAKGKKAKKSKLSGKILKQRLGQIPARLSKLSVINAIRSGTNSNPSSPPPPRRHPSPTTNDNTVVHSTPAGDTGDKDGGINAKSNNDNGMLKQQCLDPEGHGKLPETQLLMEPEMHPELPPSSLKKPHSVHRSALTKLLCGLYALMLVVFGVVFAVANSLTVKERQHLYYLEVFLLYLYLAALVTLLYFQLCVLRGKQVRTAYPDNSIRVVIRRSQDNLQLTSSLLRPPDASSPCVPPPTPDREMEDREQGLEPRGKEPLDQRSTLSNASDLRANLVLPSDGQVAHVGEGINFYLRLGALAFSLGSVTLDGFHIATYFETADTNTCESDIFILVYVCHLIFTFVQTFFLFKNHKLVIDKNKAAVRFGLMHLLATNVCVWFVTAVTETAEDYRQQDYHHSLSLDNRSVVNRTKSCYEDMTLARTASPYLFPCTIIYSIIAAGVVYRMYTYVGVKIKQRWPSHTSLTSSAAPQGVVSMDCEKANKGLFTGLLVAVVTLIAIATFFVFDSRLHNPMAAIKVFFVTEMSLLGLTGGCLVAGQVKFLKLRFLHNCYLSLDAVLLLVSLAGAYVYLCFMLISSASTMADYGVVSVLSLLTIVVGLLQSTLQAVFVLDGLCRRALNDTQVEQKPGRAVVTFLLVCNLALWVVTLFEIRKTMVLPFHLAFYGILPWNIVLHLCVPLYIYFRFHSAICLSKIWFNAYHKGD